MTTTTIDRSLGRLEGKVDSILEQVKKTNGNVKDNREAVITHDNRIQKLEDTQETQEKTRDFSFKKWTITITIIIFTVNLLIHYLPR